MSRVSPRDAIFGEPTAAEPVAAGDFDFVAPEHADFPPIVIVAVTVPREPCTSSAWTGATPASFWPQAAQSAVSARTSASDLHIALRAANDDPLLSGVASLHEAKGKRIRVPLPATGPRCSNKRHDGRIHQDRGE